MSEHEGDLLILAEDSSVVRFENVGLRYGSGPEILRDITFRLAAGDFRFLLGPSGAGKSSLLRLLYLAVKPTRGVVSLFDRNVGTIHRHEIPGFRRRIGVVFQDFRLLDQLSALENVALPLRIAGVRDSEVRRHVEELLSWVGLEDFLEATPKTMSGGQKQRLAIARAVIARPKLLLADEPTGNVDDRIAMRLMYLFEELNKLGTTIIIATHNQGLVHRFQYPVMRIDHGVLQLPMSESPPPAPLVKERL